MLPSGLPVYFLVSLLVLLAQGDGSSKKKNPVAAPPSPGGDPSWTLGLSLFKKLRADPGAVNTLFSPLLVASLLQALGGGSAGSTAKQLQDLLEASSSSSSSSSLLSTAWKSFVQANGSSFHLFTSSALFSKEAPALRSSFLKDSEASFGMKHQILKKEGEDKKELKSWAKTGLGGQDGAPLEAELQAKAGALILANAVRVTGLWEREFSEENTDHRTFLGKKYTKVTMMHRAGLYRHLEDVQNMVQVLEAPLWGGKASVLLLLPFHVESLARLEKLLTPQLLSGWLEKANTTSVSISLPRANISSTLSLQNTLSALGLKDVWDQSSADFSGVSEGSRGKLHLAGVLQWASVELAAKAGKRASDLEEEHVEKPKLFYADHPFILFVRDNVTGALLLVGAVDHVEGEALHDEL